MPVLHDNDTSLIRGKKKDSSAVYFESGLQYFKAGNYNDALKLFVYADSTEPKPEYELWIGKTYRQLNKGEQQLLVMKRILDTYPESDVADDALFEIAFHYQVTDDYEKAISMYTKLAEQYPFGKSYSNGESFREVAKRQIQTMRSDLAATLRTLGYTGERIDDLCAQFQREKNFRVTGQPDQATVLAVKRAHDDYVLKEEKAAQEKIAFDKHQRIGFACGALFVVVLILFFFLKMNIAAKRSHVDELERSIEDIDKRNI
jgi:tetratricopeptide (TPR) repeat protein